MSFDTTIFIIDHLLNFLLPKHHSTTTIILIFLLIFSFFFLFLFLFLTFTIIVRTLTSTPLSVTATTYHGHTLSNLSWHNITHYHLFPRNSGPTPSSHYQTPLHFLSIHGCYSILQETWVSYIWFLALVFENLGLFMDSYLFFYSLIHVHGLGYSWLLFHSSRNMAKLSLIFNISLWKFGLVCGLLFGLLLIDSFIHFILSLKI